MYEIRKIIDNEEFRELKDSWNICCLNDSECSPFQFFEWQYNYYSIFGNTKELAIYIVFDVTNSNIIAIFPFWERTIEKGKLLEFIGCRGVDYLMPIVANEHKMLVYKLFEQYIKENDLNIYVHDVPQNHSFYDFFYILSASNEITTPCGILNLNDIRKYKEFEYDKRFLNKHNKAIHISIYLDKVIPTVLLERHIEEYINIAENKYKHDDAKKFQQFLTIYLNEINTKKDVLYADLQNDKELMYSIVGIKCRKTIFLLNFVFNFKYKKFAPGKMLLNELIYFASENGYDKIDFSRGADIYKTKLRCSFINNMSFIISNDNDIKKNVTQLNEGIGFFPSCK